MDSDAFSGSTSSLDDSCESGDDLETADYIEVDCFTNRTLYLPECFCKDEEVFNEVLSLNTWKSVLNENHKKRLQKFLPVFPEDNETEKNSRYLFQGEIFKFTSPFKEFFRKLKDGVLSSEIVEITNALKQANVMEYKNQQKHYSYQLFHDILFSRKKLIDASYILPPDQAVKMQQFITKPKDVTLSERTRLRYFSVLQDLREEAEEIGTSSEEENYPDFKRTFSLESSRPKLSRKFKYPQSHELFLNSENSHIFATTTCFLPDFPGTSRFLSFNMLEVSEERYRDLLTSYREKSILNPDHPELVTFKIDLKGVTSRCNFAKRPSCKLSDNATRKKLRVSVLCEKSGSAQPTSDSYETENSLSSATVIKDEPVMESSVPETMFKESSPSRQEIEVQTDPVTTKVEIKDDQSDGGNIQNIKSSPQNEIHQYPTCFFALLRDIFCESVEQKLSAIKLEDKVKNWQGGPTAALFEWLNFQESWSDLVSSALRFLAGDLINILPETFVPFLDYKEKQQQWQWIGSGRDSDEQMYGLCQQWLETKDDISSDNMDSLQGSPPPSRVPTGWTVRPTVEDEKNKYRQQECIRYQNPHKAFTFKVHDYEAVVGPVKGVYGKENGVNKAREHSLLISDRPPFVTILSLVRDSASRLPNGEGTRADICELLKDSQYLSPASEQQIHTVVSGALDRLHYEKDPCVKYDVNRKLWIYLHRHRTEEEFERIHQAQAAAAKARKAIQKNKIPKFGSPKASSAANRHALATAGNSQTDIKCGVLGTENPNKSFESVKTEPTEDLPTQNVDSMQQTVISSISAHVHDLCNSGQSFSSNLSFPTTKGIIGNLNATQIVSVTPIQIKPCPTDQIRAIGNISAHMHEVLNVDMKPSSPSFVGQPPVLQPILTHHNVDKSTSFSTVATSLSTALISSTTPAVNKPKVTCTNLANLQTSITGFQTIVIKQEPGMKTCSGVSTVPLLAIEERLPTANSSGPVVARLLHGSQYLSFSNLVPGSTACATSKPIAGTVQNFRIQGGNICSPFLSASTLKVVNSSPVSAVTDSRLPVIAIKSQVGSMKEQSVISPATTSLSVCGKLFQMTNIRNAVFGKDLEVKVPEKAFPIEKNEKAVICPKTTDVTFPALTVVTTAHNTPFVITNRNTQTVIKVSPKPNCKS